MESSSEEEYCTECGSKADDRCDRCEEYNCGSFECMCPCSWERNKLYCSSCHEDLDCSYEGDDEYLLNIYNLLCG